MVDKDLKEFVSTEHALAATARKALDTKTRKVTRKHTLHLFQLACEHPDATMGIEDPYHSPLYIIGSTLVANAGEDRQYYGKRLEEIDPNDEYSQMMRRRDERIDLVLGFLQEIIAEGAG